jgi:hypothetical protein
LCDTASEIKQHFIEIAILQKQIIETVLNALKQINSTISIVDENVSELDDVVVGQTTRLADLNVSF